MVSVRGLGGDPRTLRPCSALPLSRGVAGAGGLRKRTGRDPRTLRDTYINTLTYVCMCSCDPFGVWIARQTQRRRNRQRVIRAPSVRRQRKLQLLTRMTCGDAPTHEHTMPCNACMIEILGASGSSKIRFCAALGAQNPPKNQSKSKKNQ